MPEGDANSTALRLAAAALASHEQPAGGWEAPLQAHAPAEAIRALCSLAAPDAPGLEPSAQAILARLDQTGAAALFPSGPPDPGACALAYVTLKLAGLPAAAEPLIRLKDHVLRLGGLQAADAYTRLLFALFGLYPGEHLPPLPPARDWAKLPAWTRAALEPLSRLHARHIAGAHPLPTPEGFSVSELVRADLPFSDPVKEPKPGVWKRISALVKSAPPPPQPLPAPGPSLAPTPGIWLACLATGAPLPERFVPAATPVRDTALALLALAGPHAPGAAWLRSRALPGAAWPRQFAASLDSHTEETALALLALRRAEPASAPPGQPLAWLREQQGRHGGWAACTAGLDEPFRPALPFPGAFAGADPACPALTGLALEALAAWGAAPEDPAVRRGVEFLTRSQLARDGSWTSRWGVHFLHGTCFALRGLRAAGFDDHDAVVLRAGEWLRSVQNADGGWGESPASVEADEYLEAPSNAVQTAWAVLGLIAGGDRASESVRRGVDYLLRTQSPAGAWAPACAMLHVPPSVYLANPLDAISFPMLALREAGA